MIKISIIMPTYNAEEYLKEAIDSILNQTYSNFELLIIDDNSKDKTREIINAYQDDRIKLINGNCKGLPAALNVGLKNAQGEYIARMDADDISMPDRLEKQINFLTEHPEISLCSSLMMTYKDGKDLQILGKKMSADEVKVDLLFKTPIFHPTVMFRKSDFEKHNLHYNEALRGAEDFELWTRAAQYLNFEVLGDILLKYRIENNKATILNNDVTRKNHAEIIKNNFKRFNIDISSELASILDPFKDTKKVRRITWYLYSFSISNAFRKLVLLNKETNIFNNKVLLNGLTNKMKELILKDKSRQLIKKSAFFKNQYLNLCPKNDEEIHVCFTVNSSWLPYASVAILSIMLNTNSKVKIYIIHSNCSQHEINTTLKLKKQFPNLDIDFIQIDIAKELGHFNNDIFYISRDSFTRFLFPQLKPEVKKVIYSDADVVFMQDIKELYEENLDNNIIGAVKGIYHDDGSDNLRLKISKDHDYFQSGLLLIDCEKWRNEDIFNKLKTINQEQGTLKYGDQDLLNIVFEKKYKRLNYKYCTMYAQKELFNNFCLESKMALTNPVIIHYVGSRKPWNSKCDMASCFWQYAKYSPFYKRIKKTYRISKINTNKPFLQKIFSLINEYHGAEKYKVLTIFGIKLKFKVDSFEFQAQRNIISVIHPDGTEERLVKRNKIKGLKFEISGKNNKIKIVEPTKFSINTPSTIHIETNGNIIRIGKAIDAVSMYIYCVNGNKQKLIIGDNFSAGGVAFNLLEEESSIIIGEDCMMSEDVYIINSDVHCIFDQHTHTHKLINRAKGIKIGNHVWIGRHCFITKNAIIPNNCVLGINSTATKDYIEENCVIAGNPAKIIKTGIDWAAPIQPTQ